MESFKRVSSFLGKKKTELKDLLKILHKGIEIRSAHSRISFPEILSRPVALDLDNLFRGEETLLLLIGLKKELVVASNNVIGIT